MGSAHTKEPWQQGTARGFARNTIYADGNIVCEVNTSALEDGEIDSNTIRIVACVNGCAGLNPEAYRELVDTIKDILPAAEEALKRAKKNGVPDGVNVLARQRVERTRKAITHAEAK